MSIRNKLTGAALSLALMAAFGVATYAQDATTTGEAAGQSKSAGMHRGRRRHHGGPMMRIIRSLNLSDAQQDQARAIIQRFTTSIEPQRQALMELRKQREQGVLSDDVKERATVLRGQIRESLKGSHGELLAILTPEQRAQYDQMEVQWKARRETRRARRAERKARQATPAEAAPQ